jgi:hypothetical protein
MSALRAGAAPGFDQRVGIGAALALAAAVLLGLASPRGFFAGWAAALLLVSGVPLGAASLTLLYELTGGRWGRAAGPALRALSAGLRAAPLIVVPLLVGIPWLYPWYSEPPAHGSFRATYLSVGPFIGRAIGIVAIWLATGLLLARSHDPDRAPRRWPGPLLVLYLLSITVAAIDWYGSLDRHWYSTIIGLYLIVGQALTALALVVLGAARRGSPPAADTLHDWGNLLLTMVVLHAYLAYSQFFIIWNGNLPHEIAWYVPRVRGAWGGVAVVLILIEFALPFAALLARRTKRSYRSLATVAGLVLGARVLDSAWMVLPAVGRDAALGVLCYLLLVPALVVGWWRLGTVLPPRCGDSLRPAETRA